MTAEAWVLVDLGFGDSGKGTLTDFLVRDRDARLVVRYNGGAQAGHNVVAPDGRHHTFAQFGAGSLVPGVETHLGPRFVLHPGGMLVEAEALAALGEADVIARTTVDARALLVTPFQQAAGRLRELARGAARHGTCGVGVGEAVGDALAFPEETLRAAHLGRHDVLRRLLSAQQARKRQQLAGAAGLADPRAAPEWRLLADPGAVDRVLDIWTPFVGRLRVLDAERAARRLRSAGRLVFEGAHGVLLDEAWGFHPHTTWSDCTGRGALELLAGVDAEITRLGVVRAYATRHGQGPLPTGDDAHAAAHPEPHNHDRGWQGRFRTGPLDLVLLRYALEICGGVDGLAVTHLDRVADPVPVCRRYDAGPAEPELAERDRTGAVVRLRPGAAGDLGHRERLRALLEVARPLLTTFGRNELPTALERELGAAVVLVGNGPRAADKRWRRT